MSRKLEAIQFIERRIPSHGLKANHCRAMAPCHAHGEAQSPAHHLPLGAGSQRSGLSYISSSSPETPHASCRETLLPQPLTFGGGITIHLSTRQIGGILRGTHRLIKRVSGLIRERVILHLTKQPTLRKELSCLSFGPTYRYMRLAFSYMLRSLIRLATTHGANATQCGQQQKPCCRHRYLTDLD